MNGAATSDVVMPASDLPHEVRLTAPLDDPTASVAIRVEGYIQAGWMPPMGGSPVLVRTAETRFIAGKTALLRVLLQGQCLLALPGGPPGGPSCAARETCIGGACASDVVGAQGLEPYAADWAANAPDECKPANAGPPVVQVGTGQTDYLPVTAGQTLQMEKGPQGGHHVWIAVRDENLQQAGSTTTITSVVPTTGLVGPETEFAFTYHPDEGGYCKVWGLRYQVDVDGTDYHAFLGQPLDVTVRVVDPSGTVGTGTAHVTIDPQLLCPTGIAGCS
jgi:hypothetical protein